MGIKEDIEKVESKMKELENESWAMVLLKDYKKANKRLFVVILVILSMWLATIGSFIYYINTTTFEEDYREQTIEDLKDTDNISIINGDNYDKDKTNKEN